MQLYRCLCPLKLVLETSPQTQEEYSQKQMLSGEYRPMVGEYFNTEFKLMCYNFMDMNSDDKLKKHVRFMQ